MNSPSEDQVNDSDLLAFQPITIQLQHQKVTYQEPRDGETRTATFFHISGGDFDHGDASQPGNLIDEDIGDDALTIQSDITKVIHGTMRPDGPPATLIVFQFAFVPYGNYNRFKKAEVIITFSTGQVHSISPNNTWTTLPSEKQQECSHTISPSLEASLGPVKAATTYS